MSNKLIWKSILFIGVLAFAVFKLYPNFIWYSLPLEERHNQAKRKNPLAKEVIPLGLDLQGGVHLLYQIDLSKLPDVSDQTVSAAVEQNIVVITNRIDALGVANPLIARQGREFIVIQLPGVYESEEAKSLIGKTALLEFRLVKDDPILVKILDEVQKSGVRPEDVINHRLPEHIQKMVPPGLELMPLREGAYLLVTDKPEVTGKYLKQARVELGNSSQIGGLSIGFELDSEGADIFEALTGAHINERLAIVLDSQIYSAPNIQSRIPGGRGQITGSFSAQEAKNLANVLNSGNLQASMTVVEERSVGPEMGEDSIRAGARAMLVGFSLVILFMMIYYKFSGVLADAALLVQMVFLFAAMAVIKATMTMPGIAGVILSLAMSVDANVIILERVREELAKGKDIKLSIEEGYDKAFSAIWDGNVTAILAAGFLFQFGTGPIKGFGITLMLGLAISMFTCVYATKLFYDVWFTLHRPKKLSV